MVGCDSSHSFATLQDSSTECESDSRSGDQSLDSNGKRHAIDSINAQIDSLSNAQETIADRISNISNDVAGLKEDSHLFHLISWGIAAIAVLVAVISLIKLNSIQRRADRHRRDIDDLDRRINTLAQRINVAPVKKQATDVNIRSSEFSQLETRVKKLESQYRNLSQASIDERKDKQPNNPAAEARHSVNVQYGYFGLPSQMSSTKAYFKQLSDLRDSDSRFSVKVMNDEAEFTPLEGPKYINDIKSIDVIRLALDVEDDYFDANQMRVKQPGKAKKEEGGRWIITEKAIIELYK